VGRNPVNNGAMGFARGAPLIAASALVNKSILVTRNVKHFVKVKGLKIFVPTD
jgi:predicted nucleic acid-binding protein